MPGSRRIDASTLKPIASERERAAREREEIWMFGDSRKGDGFGVCGSRWMRHTAFVFGGVESGERRGAGGQGGISRQADHEWTRLPQHCHWQPGIGIASAYSLDSQRAAFAPARYIAPRDVYYTYLGQCAITADSKRVAIYLRFYTWPKNSWWSVYTSFKNIFFFSILFLIHHFLTCADGIYVVLDI